MSRPSFRIALLSLAALFFGWQTYKVWTGPLLPAGPFGPEKAPVVEDGTVPAAPPAAGLVSIGSIAARPLFRPDRRPFQENAALAPRRNYEAELNRFTVLGVLLLEDARKAVVAEKTPGKRDAWEVSAGDSLAGFTVKEVQSDGVLLEVDGRTFTLPLFAGAPRSDGRPIRTETTAPRTKAATAPAQPPPAAVTPAPAAPPADPGTAPSTVPRRVYPRRYIPGGR